MHNNMLIKREPMWNPLFCLVNQNCGEYKKDVWKILFADDISPKKK